MISWSYVTIDNLKNSDWVTKPFIQMLSNLKIKPHLGLIWEQFELQWRGLKYFTPCGDGRVVAQSSIEKSNSKLAQIKSTGQRLGAGKCIMSHCLHRVLGVKRFIFPQFVPHLATEIEFSLFLQSSIFLLLPSLTIIKVRTKTTNKSPRTVFLPFFSVTWKSSNSVRQCIFIFNKDC